MPGLGSLVGPNSDWQTQATTAELASRVIALERLVDAIAAASSVTVSTADPSVAEPGTANGQMWLNKTGRRWFIWDNENSVWNKFTPSTFR